MSSILAYDLGASSGRALLGRLTDRKIEVEELHRFGNDPVQVGDRLQWDILRLFHELKQGLLKAKHQGIKLQSLAIDSWAVDYGFIGKNGELLGNPYHYRDHHTDGVMERVLGHIPATEIFGRTGIQFLPFNTIYQLAALKEADSPLLREADRFLMIPDLLRYFLTGEMHNEFSNATSTQLYNPLESRWDPELLRLLGLSSSWFGDVVQPGTKVGQLRSSVTDELGISSVPVYAVAEHDTGSAVVAVPALDRSFAYLSCGTWSLMGTEVDQPVINELAQELNFTNEGGAYGTYRLLKNIMGLWILQESRREWERAGMTYSFPELVKLAEQASSFSAFIDPDDPLFLHPGDMPAKVQQYCRLSGQQVPDSPGAIARCILESLALKYRFVLELTERLSGKQFNGLHMVGGGIHNTLLCQWSSNAIGKPVWAGPAEGSAIGNLVVQWIAQGELSDIWEARKVISDSFPVTIYEPEQFEAWEDAYGTFRRVTGLA
ncbi:L-fuculose kinase [Paenibacillus baekrokdamisoli]|uniref:L-fuculose kinase n=1 Tax=Paenibacillus baekrokdamisoli TaxID=1712516 RepID=A0A3G9IJ36_9BACL|nr:rhamnulokinase family protein [Paenibacillus baekrokdamisoli]MBB3072635.1 rhamnulokinase [Paenibacillus baekrokdamisoli]BBH18920.1 L-fuculose kinase [Paenibacillus baekrokdamisoli]